MKYGLLGHRIDYSLSPLIHRYITPDIVYVLADLSPEELNSSKASALEEFDGFNVTIPHKKTVIEFCAEQDPSAEKTGAVNTVKRENGKLIAYNTDYLGFIRACHERVPDYEAYYPVIVGCGGAARAVLAGLKELGFKSVSVVGGLDEAERKDFIFAGERKFNISISQDISAPRILWINCTPLGSERLPDIPKDFIRFRSDDILFDLNYAPNPTYLEKKASQRGCRTVNGLYMLIYQALEAQRIWFGRKKYIEDIKGLIDLCHRKK